jgi:hypothetical protein
MKMIPNLALRVLRIFELYITSTSLVVSKTDVVVHAFLDLSAFPPFIGVMECFCLPRISPKVVIFDRMGLNVHFLLKLNYLLLNLFSKSLLLAHLINLQLHNFIIEVD